MQFRYHFRGGGARCQDHRQWCSSSRLPGRQLPSRNIPPADFAKLMYKRLGTRDVMAFCEKHKVSYDWLLCGDLAGLQRMTREHKAQAGGRLDDKWVNFLRIALITIPPHHRRAAFERVRKIAEQL